MSSHDHIDPHASRDTPGATHDPVCNHWVIPEHAYGASLYRGATINFCSRGCKLAFDGNPARFMPRYQEA